MWPVIANAQSSAAPVAGAGTRRRAAAERPDRRPGPRGTVPAPSARTAGRAGARLRRRRRVRRRARARRRRRACEDADPGDAGGRGVTADPEHLSEREIEDEAEAEGDLSEDEIQEIAASPRGRWARRRRHPEQASGAPQRGGNRAIGFLRASWAELQRVQWPDRRQVFQATAVVLGFVAIAGAYLGLADYVAKEIVEFILS